MTVIQRVKNREQTTRKALVKLLELTEDEMSLQLFEGAYVYLKNIFGTDAYGMQHLPKTKQFWDWWRMEWAKIDSIFLHAVDEHRHETNYMMETFGLPEGEVIIWKVRDREYCETYKICRTVKELRDEYNFYHEVSMKNRYMNDSIVRAGAHEMMSCIINDQKQRI